MRRSTSAVLPALSADALLLWSVIPIFAQEKKTESATGSVSSSTAAEPAERALHRRAVEAAIWGMPIVNVDAMREAFFRDAGARYGDILYLSKPADWRFQTTTPNASSLYVYFNFTPSTDRSSSTFRRRSGPCSSARSSTPGRYRSRTWAQRGGQEKGRQVPDTAAELSGGAALRLHPGAVRQLQQLCPLPRHPGVVVRRGRGDGHFAGEEATALPAVQDCKSARAAIHRHRGQELRGHRRRRRRPPRSYQVYQHTISWLPESLDVRTWAFLPENGVNLDLYSTLDTVLKHGESVTMWGPFENRPEVIRAVVENQVGPGQRRRPVSGDQHAAKSPRERLHPRRRRRRPRLRPWPLPAHPRRQAGLAFYSPAGHESERLRPGPDGRLVAVRQAGAGPLPDRGHPAGANPAAQLPVLLMSRPGRTLSHRPTGSVSSGPPGCCRTKSSRLRESIRANVALLS